MNFREFLIFQEQNTVGVHNDMAGGAYLPTNFTNSEAPDNLEGRGVSLPGLDMVSNLKSATGVIRSVGQENDNHEPTQNPIPITLSDNTKLSLTWDQYIRIGKPKRGWQMTVQFLRMKDDDSSSQSGIHSVETRDPEGKSRKFNNWPH